MYHIAICDDEIKELEKTERYLKAWLGGRAQGALPGETGFMVFYREARKLVKPTSAMLKPIFCSWRAQAITLSKVVLFAS